MPKGLRPADPDGASGALARRPISTAELLARLRIQIADRKSPDLADDHRRPLLDWTSDMIDGPDRLWDPSGGGSSGFSTGSLFSGGTAAMGTVTTAGSSGLMIGGFGRREGLESGNWAQRAQESYYLQLTLAMRLSSQAFLADQSLLRESTQAIRGGGGPSESDTVSYRLWELMGQKSQQSQGRNPHKPSRRLPEPADSPQACHAGHCTSSCRIKKAIEDATPLPDKKLVPVFDRLSKKTPMEITRSRGI